MNRIGVGILAAMAGLWAATDAYAVRIAETGQALIYPYYSVAKKADGTAHNTYFSVVNTAADTKVMRVRISEGRNHRAVLWFNLHLPPKGTWTAAIVPGEGINAPRIITADKSCTRPAIPQSGQPLRDLAFTGPNADLAGTDPERLTEGFIEVIEMATLSDPGAAAAMPGADGAPANCGLFQAPNLQLPGLGQPTGGLTGIATIINVGGGYDVVQRATALAGFSASQIYHDTSDEAPSLDAADPVSTFTLGAKTYRATWSPVTVGARTVSGGAAAVSSVLMAASIGNEVMLDKATASNTEWVVTMPTRRFFVGPEGAVQPFSKPFRTAGDCEAATISVAGRDGAEAEVSTSVKACWSTLAINFNDSEPHTQPRPGSMPGAPSTSPVLGSRNMVSIPFGANLQNGIATMRYGEGSITSDAATRAVDLATGETQIGSVTLKGLPSMGFAISTFNNGQVSCGSATCKSTFAAAVPHVAGY